ncbi:hypothetical protein [Bacillus sp. AFS040349]|uniref:hypothetical protein n=1 Tax=Bacillus sp. AFS040349 TaxID=2033502 RepID=UPI000BFC4071|nr:hypothetical protein [Bacillus sp. AFS040349]PGT80573.1 hypothetical protein COD11_20905 [Bacillus sp. AFS040349]
MPIKNTNNDNDNFHFLKEMHNVELKNKAHMYFQRTMMYACVTFCLLLTINAFIKFFKYREISAYVLAVPSLLTLFGIFLVWIYNKLRAQAEKEIENRNLN